MVSNEFIFTMEYHPFNCCGTSGTRFGEILPHEQNLTQLWQILKDPLSVW